MKINEWLKFGEWVKIVFGTGWLDRFVVFENKYLASLYVNKWHVIEHDRHHTHAFAAISIGIKGGYLEEILEEDGTKHVEIHTAPWIRFISRDNNHRMLKSTPSAISITIAGPWDKVWSETLMDGTIRILGWGRKEVVRQNPAIEARVQEIWREIDMSVASNTDPYQEGNNL